MKKANLAVSTAIIAIATGFTAMGEHGIVMPMAGGTTTETEPT